MYLSIASCPVRSISASVKALAYPDLPFRQSHPIAFLVFILVYLFSLFFVAFVQRPAIVWPQLIAAPINRSPQLSKLCAYRFEFKKPRTRIGPIPSSAISATDSPRSPCARRWPTRNRIWHGANDIGRAGIAETTKTPWGSVISINNQQNKPMKTNESPKLGDIVTVRGIKCRVFRIHPFGTMDVEALDGSVCFRVTGLNFR